MDLKDLIVTPFYFAFILLIARWVRPLFTNPRTIKFFMPALIFRLVAAILVGMLYQFYYDGGDTFNFHTRGSTIVAEVFRENPAKGVQLFLSNGTYIKGIYNEISQIPFYRDTSSYMIIRIAAFFDLFTFSTYTSTALFFALFAFSGLWALYNVFEKHYPERSNILAITVLFIPSVVFWGSGILKDTITIGAVGWLVYGTYQCVFLRRRLVLNILIVLFSAYLIYIIKIYILLAVVPAILIWILLSRVVGIRNTVLRYMLAPLLIVGGLALTYYLVDSITKNDARYSIDTIAKTARITAYDIAFWTGRDAGSTYSLGELDGTMAGMLRLAPGAVVVSLFRPFPWEIRNALMIFLSLESLLILITTVYVFFRVGFVMFFKSLTQPLILFCLIFSLVFAFAVGVSTYNFGSLARYKIPLLPFYLSMLAMVYAEWKRSRTSGQANLTE